MGVYGMKWGQHIFGDRYKYKSIEQLALSRKVKKLGKNVNKNTNSEYRKLKNKLKKIKKRDKSRYEKFLKENKENEELKKTVPKKEQILKKQ